MIHKADRYRDNFPQSRPPGSPPAREMLQTHMSGSEVVTPAGMLFVMGDNREIPRTAGIGLRAS